MLVIKFKYLAMVNSKRFFYISNKFSFFIQNEKYDKIIVTRFYTIIYCSFVISLAYIIC